MKNTLKYLMTLGLVGSMFLVTGCPEENNEEGCTSTEDCDGELVCNTESNTCEEASSSCADDSACTADGEYCLGEGENKVCRQPVSCGELADAAVAASYCGNQVADFDAETEIAFCDSSVDADAPTCESKAKLEYRVVSVKDFSGLQEDGSIDNTSCEMSTAIGGTVKDAGSDIITVNLLDADGETIGFGRAVELEVGSGEPDFVNAETVFSGQARADGYFQGVCPAGEEVGGTPRQFRDNSVVSLGCGGSLFMEFADADGEVILVDPSAHKIEVAEFGPYCDGEGGGTPAEGEYGTDKFSVFLCATAINDTAAEIGDEDCVYELTDGVEQGFAEVTLSSNTQIEADASDTSFPSTDGAE